MPEAVERCVESLLAKWKKDPSSRPKPKKEGQDEKSQAWAICQASHKKSVQNMLEVMLEGGYGPTLLGAAATNRPFIPQLEETRVVEEEDGSKHLVVHLANPGTFDHPAGPFVLNRAIFNNMISNFNTNILGQRAAYDCRHKPDTGAFGWFKDLWIDGKGRFYGRVDPTPVGLEAAENKLYIYSSMEFHRNWERDDVKLDLERATQFCIALEEEEDDEQEVNDMGQDEDRTVELERQLEEEQAKIKAEQERAKELEGRLKAAEEHALELEQMAIKSEMNTVVELAVNHRDKDGNALPRPLVEWVAKVLKMEDFGEGSDVVKLEDDQKPNAAFMRYLAGAVKALVLSMPGVVPTNKESSSDDDGDSGDEEFDFGKLWE